MRRCFHCQWTLNFDKVYIVQLDIRRSRSPDRRADFKCMLLLRLDTHSYHCCQAARLDSHWSIKCGSKSLGQSACLKSIPRTFTSHRGSYMRAQVLLNLLNELRKRDKM